MSAAPNLSLSALLKTVSRSFYLTLRVLPACIRPQIGLAYLLARATDTIADTGIVPAVRRLEALEALRRRIQGAGEAALDFGELAGHQASSGEAALLRNLEVGFRSLQHLSAHDLGLVRKVLDTITSGQALDLRRFAEGSQQQVLALATGVELDDYAYRVAGCVGEFWTKMCRAHVFPGAQLDDAWLLAHGVQFGKGLQLVNILRDLPRDLRQGRCYLPLERLSPLGLKPADLLEPVNEPRMRPFYNELVEQAQAHLTAGWAYTNALPRRCVRVRLACAWPALIGLETLHLLRVAPVLDPQRRIKITRARVRQLMTRSVLLIPWPGAWMKMGPPVR